MRRFAVTGGIGEGKSTVLAEFAALGAITDSADAIARRVFQLPEVQSALGQQLGGSGPVTSAHLREAIALDPTLRRRVNGIMHPRILTGIQDSPAEFFEVPLLIETCLHPLFDAVVVVTCGPEEQLRRLKQRYGDDFPVARMLETQLPTRAKIPFAHEIVRTDQPVEAVRVHATRVLTRLRLV